jgi:aspartyl-tRNA(Asn)/glutamyl-tRNA(Gln) amidotransferase subunit C
MLEIKDIENLAKLARIELSDSEKKSLLKEIEPILGYVAQLKEVTSVVGEEKVAGEHRNIIREDANVTESETYTEAIVAEFPEKDKNYLKVKKIL